MKITKQQLKQIIKEELEVVLSDAEAREFFGDGIPKQISEDKGKVTVIATRRRSTEGGGDLSFPQSEPRTYDIGDEFLKTLKPAGYKYGLDSPSHAGKTFHVEYDVDGTILSVTPARRKDNK